MAIIYNGTTLSNLTFNGVNVSSAYVCDTSTGCFTRVFPDNYEYCMPTSIICHYNDIDSVYCYGASGSFGDNAICGQQLCLYACTEYFCAYLDTSSTSLCFASLCFDTSDFIGNTLEIETCNVAAQLNLTSRCEYCHGCGCTAAINTTTLIDDGNIRSTAISGATTCVNLISPSNCVYGCMCCCNFGACFQNFVKNVCRVDTCIFYFWLIPEEGFKNSCIYVRIKDSAGNILLCGTYIPTCACVVLN